jgi:hypothetical protein
MLGVQAIRGSVLQTESISLVRVILEHYGDGLERFRMARALRMKSSEGCDKRGKIEEDLAQPLDPALGTSALQGVTPAWFLAWCFGLHKSCPGRCGTSASLGASVRRSFR